jgi:hypothetical protein
MSNGPSTYQGAVNAAQQSQQNGTSNNTSGWSYNARVTYAANGGK